GNRCNSVLNCAWIAHVALKGHDPTVELMQASRGRPILGGISTDNRDVRASSRQGQCHPLADSGVTACDESNSSVQIEGGAADGLSCASTWSGWTQSGHLFCPFRLNPYNSYHITCRAVPRF